MEAMAGTIALKPGGSHASPAILMRSGLGPAAGLRDLGIAVAADLPAAPGHAAPLPGDAHGALRPGRPGRATRSSADGGNGVLLSRTQVIREAGAFGPIEVVTGFDGG
jgi:GMC oxidoreductase